MARNEVHPESSDRAAFCAVDTEYPGSDADNQGVDFHFRRSIKLLSGMRLNFRRRGISTSVGVHGASLVTLGKTGTRTTVALPGSGLSYAHMEESRVVGFVAPASNPSLTSNVLPGRDWRGLLWIGLVVLAIAAAAAQTMK